MNAPARKLNLEDLLRKWWDTKKNVQQIEQVIEGYQNSLDDAIRDLGLIADNVSRAAECHEETMVFTLSDATIVLAWQVDQNYHSIELVNVETI
jgi:hypothetical protein